jgi:hypothetical protein
VLLAAVLPTVLAVVLAVAVVPCCCMRHPWA